MPISQRPAVRFFVTFYRWSRYTQSPPRCSFNHRFYYRHAGTVRPVNRYSGSRGFFGVFKPKETVAGQKEVGMEENIGEREMKEDNIQALSDQDAGKAKVEEIAEVRESPLKEDKIKEEDRSSELREEVNTGDAAETYIESLAKDAPMVAAHERSQSEEETGGTDKNISAGDSSSELRDDISTGDAKTFIEILTKDEQMVEKDSALEKRQENFPEEETERSSLQPSNPTGQEDGVEFDDFTPNKGLADKGSAALREKVRQVMRNVSHPVVLVTAASADPKSKEMVTRAMAVSSFNTITLDPPTISFNVRQPSHTSDAIRADRGRFRVHFLQANTVGARIADLFTRGNSDEAWSNLAKLIPSRYNNRVSKSRHSLTNAPYVDSPAVLACMECELVNEVKVADHVIAIAKVLRTTATAKSSSYSTLQYHQGTYAGDGEPIFSRQELIAPETLAFNYYDLPVFPGDAERHFLLHRIKQYVDSRPQLLRLDVSKATNQIRADFNLRLGALGLNVRSLLAHASREAGLSTGDLVFQPVLYDFYGNVNPENIATIVDRARQLAHKHPDVLQAHWIVLAGFLGVDPYCSGLLASDILESLREEGLVGAFQPGRDVLQAKGVHTLEFIERIEHRLKEIFLRYDPSTAMALRTEQISPNINHNPWLKGYIKQVRGRLHVETAREFFKRRNVDISGEVTAVERRVVVARILRYHVGHMINFLPRLAVPEWGMCYNVGIHPLVSGVDITFLRSKLAHLYYKTKDPAAFVQIVEKEITSKWFDKELSQEELERRIHEYVDRDPRRAVRWSKEDLLAAIGIDQDAVVVDPDKGVRHKVWLYRLSPLILVQALRKKFPDKDKIDDQEIAAFLDPPKRVKKFMTSPQGDGNAPQQKTDLYIPKPEALEERPITGGAKPKLKKPNMKVRYGVGSPEGTAAPKEDTLVRRVNSSTGEFWTAEVVEGGEYVPSFRIRKGWVGAYEGPRNPAETETPARPEKGEGFQGYGFEGRKE
ncbi:uncharacterized protein BDR25DRAFT_343180 [Lindgomyces ingoldianus]|uniref:Uncharacterized protein n=1 Tax=Lindgomyces ingoldianus TaxID=673940 RepID=A0ACB6QU92_9PLEO|nr:uncharacterized protein BDR25DRAFT_343180 [Lindgomyces ingoldianus]KAF2470460.1 hypothetical protein BDR25DRAFT_343180 [Lindgomyces ingoldianus]